jgi:hypothetical protein
MRQMSELLVGIGLLLTLWNCGVNKQSDAEKYPEVAERLIVRLTRMEVSRDGRRVTVEGTIKNDTDTTFQDVCLRFEFYDAYLRLVHTEKRWVIFFQRFRPNDVYYFHEYFFRMPPEVYYVRAHAEDFIKAR